ncbi:putative uncharacterized protein [Bacteroides sp. CAG:530]|nr:putative uncharacterized protein [Bacteroides sp. CAG:530]
MDRLFQFPSEMQLYQRAKKKYAARKYAGKVMFVETNPCTEFCGETKIVRLSSLGLHKNLSPYNAYKQGKLVKLPFLGSQYINLND